MGTRDGCSEWVGGKWWKVGDGVGGGVGWWVVGSGHRAGVIIARAEARNTLAS